MMNTSEFRVLFVTPSNSSNRIKVDLLAADQEIYTIECQGEEIRFDFEQ
jgi:hypothetical protein